MKWIEINVVTSAEASEAISELLMNKGADGTEIIDASAFRQALENNRYLDYADDGLIESYGNDVTVKAYFSDDTDVAAIKKDIEGLLSNLTEYMNIGPGEIKYAVRDDNEWKYVWKQYFKPFRLTERIIIKPSWEEYCPQPDDIVIELDPGMAFGTGTHETTRMCAVLGEKHIKKGDRVLDLGCGTAILALTAVKLGAASALAVDIDEAAVKAARQNVENNRESERVIIMRGELRDVPREPYDLIFINIIADIIIELSQDIIHYIKSGTRIMLSGIIKSRSRDVKERFLELGFNPIDEITAGEWVAMVFNA